jgi:2-C-methyl-D-erythritol 2,4-cyclodiphosphate synthase
MYLAEQVYKLLCDQGYSIVNIDATVIAQKPKLAPYISEMKTNVASIFRISPEQVNIKATTEENLGFTGRLEGISSHAVCLITK